MLEYKPWSQEELRKSYAKYQKGDFSILDIEVSGHCNFNCVYCDSPDHTKECMIDIRDVEKLLCSYCFDWVFICGLGEPIAGINYQFFLEILKLCRKYNVKCSIFSNMSICGEEILEFVDEGILHILFKFDSDSYRLNANVYGTTNFAAKQQYDNIQTLIRHVHCENNITNIGASIVPTRLNIDTIPQIVEECCKNQIYPLIAELENSGRGQEHFSNLSLSADELQSLKRSVEEITGEKYNIPICPAVISGIHVSNESDIVVDELSGLTCPWFWLEEPQLYKVLKLNSETTLNEIKYNIIKFRNKRLDKVEELKTAYLAKKKIGFGGCGGDIRLLLESYVEIQKSLKAVDS